MTNLNNIMKNPADNTREKADRILTLTEELHDLQNKRKSVAAAFTTRIKEVKQDILDVLNDEQTAEEIVKNVHNEHDLEVIK